MYLTVKLEAGSDVRSVPLGDKRKCGRPKKLPSNCLPKSPEVVRNEAADETFNGVQTNNDDEDEENLRKRRHLIIIEEDHQQSPVEALLSQTQEPGPSLRKLNSKPPKKTSKTKTKPADKSVLSASNSRKYPDDTEDSIKPSAVVCKKRKGSCTHEIVFGVHYDKKSWIKYADIVRKKKSSVEIDPNYMC